MQLASRFIVCTSVTATGSVLFRLVMGPVTLSVGQALGLSAVMAGLFFVGAALGGRGLLRF